MKINIDTSQTKLGEGRFGSVYKVYDQDSQQSYAAKVFDKNPPGQPNFGKRLCEREYHMLKIVQGHDGVGHPNILRLIGLNGPNAIVLQLAEYGDLLDIMQQYANRGVPGPAAEKTIRGIFSGLEFLHEACGVMHGDLKPENIMMLSPSTPLLADFDATIELGKVLPFVRGTEEYLAPEFMASLRADLCDNASDASFIACGAADVWSAGMIALALCTGVHAWNIEPPPPSEGSSAAPFWLWRVAQQARKSADTKNSLPALCTPWTHLLTKNLASKLILSILCESKSEKRPHARQVLDNLGQSGFLANEIDQFETQMTSSPVTSTVETGWHFWHIFNAKKNNRKGSAEQLEPDTASSANSDISRTDKTSSASGHSRGWHLWHSHRKLLYSRSPSPMKRKHVAREPPSSHTPDVGRKIFPGSSKLSPVVSRKSEAQLEQPGTPERGRSSVRRSSVNNYRHGWHLWGATVDTTKVNKPKRSIDDFRSGWKLSVGGWMPEQTKEVERPFIIGYDKSALRKAALAAAKLDKPGSEGRKDSNKEKSEVQSGPTTDCSKAKANSPSRPKKHGGVESFRDNWNMSRGGWMPEQSYRPKTPPRAQVSDL